MLKRISKSIEHFEKTFRKAFRKAFAFGTWRGKIEFLPWSVGWQIAFSLSVATVNIVSRSHFNKKWTVPDRNTSYVDVLANIRFNVSRLASSNSKFWISFFSYFAKLGNWNLQLLLSPFLEHSTVANPWFGTCYSARLRNWNFRKPGRFKLELPGSPELELATPAKSQFGLCFATSFFLAILPFSQGLHLLILPQHTIWH